MKIGIPHLLAVLFSLAFFVGCESFYLSQSNMFVDEDGAVIAVDYGKIDKDHISTFTTPNGKELEFKSRFSVRVVMPDGTSFQAYQCFNELLYGALYRSNDEKWTYHANGSSCTVYELVEGKLYKPVFFGVVCRGPEKPSVEQRR